MKDAADLGRDQQIPTLEEAAGWDGAVVEGVDHYVITVKIKVTGHYEVDRNRCRFREDFGPLPLDEWNRLARAMNAAMKSTPPREPVCVTLRNGNGMDDKIYYLKGSDRRLLFEVKYGASGPEACTEVIGNPKLAQDAADMLNRSAIRAAWEGCDGMPPLN